MMDNYPKHIKYTNQTPCSVDGCKRKPYVEVILYDFYDFANETFYEQDYSCPFLCLEHMQINEEKATGSRVPRGNVHYPYTNKDGAQGFSKYNPLKNIYPLLFTSGEAENNSELQISLKEINEELIYYLAKSPEFIHQLHHRKFEELIAEIFRKKGYEVTLTPQTRDGGKDIIAVYNSPFGHQMFIVECKKYKEDFKVGVELVRGLYGVKTAERFTQAILVTSSSFTEDAKRFVKPLEYELSLKDFNDVKGWCEDYSKR
jgi:hypothetical protein